MHLVYHLSSSLKMLTELSLSVGGSGEQIMFTCLVLLLLRSVGPSMLKSVGFSSKSCVLRVSTSPSLGSDLMAMWPSIWLVQADVRVGDICCLSSDMFLMFFNSVGFLRNLDGFKHKIMRIDLRFHNVIIICDSNTEVR